MRAEGVFDGELVQAELGVELGELLPGGRAEVHHTTMSGSSR